MNYIESINYIHSTPKFSRILGNDLLRVLLEKLGNPHKYLKYVHIAGTNGKGSTAAMLSSVLIQAGYKTGLFTSPYIERFNERIKINGEDIADDDLANITTEIKNIIDLHGCEVSEFALDTAIAFMYFKKHKCDIVILETGLGGRLDATNVIDESLVSVITSVSLDHTQYLGNTIEEIAQEKADIIKNNSDTVLYSQNPDSVKEIISKKCLERKSNLHLSDEPKIRLGCLEIGNIAINLPLFGSYQMHNAMTAIKTLEVLNKKGYKISADDIYTGISNVSWPVRFEYLNERLIVDGAHNYDAIERLTDELENLSTPLLPVIAMMSDKEVSRCVDIISKKFNKVITSQINMPRCLPSDELKQMFIDKGVDAVSIKNPTEAVNTALKSDLTVCVFGSLYLAGEVRRAFKKEM